MLRVPLAERLYAIADGNAREPGRESRPRLRATFNRTGGVRHLFAAYDLGRPARGVRQRRT
jgi:hypothetical protein